MKNTGKLNKVTSRKEIGTGFISELDRYLFGEGTHYNIFEKLGAHPKTYKGKKGFYFAVWAPHAKAVSLVGDFNNWDPETDLMTPLADSGIYELFVPEMKAGELYKFAITTQAGRILFKADPYAFSAEYRPGTASKKLLFLSMRFIWVHGEKPAARRKTASIHIGRQPMSWQNM